MSRPTCLVHGCQAGLLRARSAHVWTRSLCSLEGTRPTCLCCLYRSLGRKALSRPPHIQLRGVFRHTVRELGTRTNKSIILAYCFCLQEMSSAGFGSPPLLRVAREHDVCIAVYSGGWRVRRATFGRVFPACICTQGPIYTYRGLAAEGRAPDPAPPSRGRRPRAMGTIAVYWGLGGQAPGGHTPA